MRRAIVLIVLSLGFAPAPFLKPERDRELQKLQGEWIFVEAFSEGIPDNVIPGEWSIRINGRQVLQYYNGKFDRVVSILSHDARRSPRVLDRRRVTGFYKGKNDFGIYRLEGDKLTIYSRLSDSEGDRPTDFDPNCKGIKTQVFERRKKQ